MTEHTLHPIVATVAASLSLDAGRLVLPPEAELAAREACAALSMERRDAVGIDLLALAVKIARAGIPADKPFSAITLLAIGLVGEARVQDAFGAAGVDRQRARAIGTSATTRAPAAEFGAKASAVKPTRGLRRT